MAPRASEHRKLAAIMFTDMVGYSALAQRNEALALELLEEHRRIVRGMLPLHDGREVKTTGDGFLIEFPSALAAVQCAVAVQQALHERNQAQPPERQVRIRIGIHVGDVVSRDGDIHGDGVNIAARLEPLAEPGGICVSNAVFDQVRNKLEHSLTALGPAELKHIELPVLVHRVVLPWLPTARAPARHPAWRPARAPRSRLWLAVVVVLILTGSVVTWLRHTRPGGDTAPIKSIAVLPLLSRSTNTQDLIWAEAMTSEVIGQLTKIKTLQVRSLATVKRYASADRDELAAGRDLKVDAIVYGTVERLGERLQVEARLARVATGNELWSDTHRLRTAELLEFQDHLAADIVRAIRVEITPQDRVRMARKETTNLEAWNAFHTGMYHWFREDQGSISNALHYFTLATRADTNFAAAWAGMAAVHTLSAGVGMPFTNTWTAWKAPAERALFLDPDLPLANAHYGMGLLILERDPVQAERYLRRALELDPLDPLGWNCYGNLLYARNEPEAAIRHGRKATELEPTVPFWWLDLAWFLNAAGRHEEALKAADQGLELMKFQSGLGRNQKGWSYLLLKRYREALDEFGAAVALEGENPGFRFGLGCALAQAGQRDAAQRTLAELQALRTERPVARVYTAGILLALGDREAALTELERGTKEPDAALWWLGGDPWFAQLRDEPRFQAVLKAGRKPLN